MGTKNNINQASKRNTNQLARIRKRDSKSWKTAIHGKSVPVISMTKERSKKKQKQLEKAIKHELRRSAAKDTSTREIEMKDAPEKSQNDKNVSNDVQQKFFGAGTTLGGPPVLV